MAWESKYSNYGVLKIEGDKVNVFFWSTKFLLHLGWGNGDKWSMVS
jgi:hypothetical protein